MLDDAVRLDEKAREAGVQSALDIFPGMQHVFHFMAGNAPEADRAVRDIAV